MAVRVLIQFVNPTMRLASPIWDCDGKPAAGRGSFLRDGMVRMLRDMGLLSVVVEGADELPSWEIIRDLRQLLLELNERFERDQDSEQSEPMVQLRMAIARHFTAQAELLEADPVVAAMRDPEGGDS